MINRTSIIKQPDKISFFERDFAAGQYANSFIFMKVPNLLSFYSDTKLKLNSS